LNFASFVQAKEVKKQKIALFKLLNGEYGKLYLTITALTITNFITSINPIFNNTLLPWLISIIKYFYTSHDEPRNTTTSQ
jgi:hypothetical protein